MALLWLVTFGWAFSFSLIDVYLAAQVDGYFAVFTRVALALALFLPLLRRRSVPARTGLALAGIGAVQLGIMYLFLYEAFRYLEVAELLLFTVFTPLWITLIDELASRRMHLPLQWWLAAGLAVLGAAIIRYDRVSADAVTGFLLIQAANLCFAAGQVFYRRLPLGSALQQAQVMAFFFLGASLASGVGFLLFGDAARLPHTAQQWLVLAWLGLGASGLGYYAWNIGIRRVNTAEVATMNNMLIPAGILVNFIFWNRDVDWARLLAGGSVIALSVWLAGRPARRRPS